MKWGGVLSVKKWKMEVYGVVKRWTFPQCRVHYVQYQFFILHYTYLGGCVHTQRTPTAHGLVQTDNIMPTPGIFDDKKNLKLRKKIDTAPASSYTQWSKEFLFFSLKRLKR